MLEGDREGAKLRYVFCRSLLCMAERDERKPERLTQRILPQGQKFVEGKPLDTKKESGVDQRQTKKGSWFLKTY